MMEVPIPYTRFKLGQSHLHQLHTAQGRVFIAGEVASSLFALSPTAFLQELRLGKYPKLVLSHPDALRAVAALALPIESSAGASGVAALTAAAVQQLMVDRRRLDLLQPFRLALLKLASQEAARLMAEGRYDAALPVALDAVKQAHLGLRRVQQCSDALCLAGLLVLKEPVLTTPLMRSQLARLNGQLAALQGKAYEALGWFARDVYHCSVEYGPRDVRTSLGYFNLGKVLVASGNNIQGALACADIVFSIWREALEPLVLGPTAAGVTTDGSAATVDSTHQQGSWPTGGCKLCGPSTSGPGSSTATGAAVPARLPVGPLQLMEVVDMLRDATRLRERERGPGHPSVGEGHFAAALALLHLRDAEGARHELAHADALVPLADARGRALLGAAYEVADAVAANGVGAGSDGATGRWADSGAWSSSSGANWWLRGAAPATLKEPNVRG